MPYAKTSDLILYALVGCAVPLATTLLAVNPSENTLASHVVEFFDPPPKIAATASGHFCAGQGKVDATVSNLDVGEVYQVYFSQSTNSRRGHEQTIRANPEGQGFARWRNLSVSNEWCRNPANTTGHLTLVVIPSESPKPGQHSTSRIPFPAR